MAERQVRWAGGPVAVNGDGSRVYHLHQRVGGHRWTMSLGPMVTSEAEANKELAVFRVDPAAYQPPGARAAAKVRAKAEAEAAADETKRAGAVIVTPELIAAFVESLMTGRHGRKPRSKKYGKAMRHYVTEWAAGPSRGKPAALLHGRDMRTVTLPEFHTALDRYGKVARRHRITAIKTFAAYLRHRGLLTSQTDPTVDLKCENPPEPTEAQKAAKVYTDQHLELHYKHLDRQDVRDVIFVRAMTGMHLTEIARVAEGVHGRLEAFVGDDPDIGGRAVFHHKRQSTHSQTINRATFAAFTRIVARKRIPDSKSLINCMDRANEAARIEVKDDKLASVEIAWLRHTFVTRTRKAGRKVTVPDTEAIPLADIAAAIGHTDKKTTQKFYDASEWPPLYIPPYKLWHPNDPVVPGVRHLRAVS